MDSYLTPQWARGIVASAFLNSGYVFVTLGMLSVFVLIIVKPVLIMTVPIVLIGAGWSCFLIAGVLTLVVTIREKRRNQA